MRRALIALAATLAPAAAAPADAPKASIRGPASVAPGGLILLDARESVSDRPLKWKLDGSDVPWFALDQGEKRGVVLIVPSAAPGVYKFTLIARGVPPGDKEIDADAAVWLVTVGGPPPGPAPTPVDPPTPPPPVNPDDKPRPPPVAGTLHVSLVVDLDVLTPEVARMREGIKAREAFKAVDAVYRTHASTSPDLARLNLAAVVQSKGLPCLVVQDHTGRVIAAEAAPADEAALIERVKLIRGGAR